MPVIRKRKRKDGDTRRRLRISIYYLIEEELAIGAQPCPDDPDGRHAWNPGGALPLGSICFNGCGGSRIPYPLSERFRCGLY